MHFISGIGSIKVSNSFIFVSTNFYIIFSHLIPDCYIWGGKGVGSQGDGTAQFIAKDENSQRQLIEIINLDFPKMQCFQLVVRA
ncbi:MAG: hypothetical protein O4805_00710 [Trichodesmium sp. St16_bin2-tuft]|nr:hypothetical protein [Trichodesmium sp. St16_bin2-tuft]